MSAAAQNPPELMPKLTNIRDNSHIFFISQDQSDPIQAGRIIVNRQRVQMMIAQAATPPLP
jgi:hypothetical protein